MIGKGKSRAGARSLAAHLLNAEKNERVQLIESRGTISRDLTGALIEMEAVAAGTRCQKPLYHCAISPEPPHRLTPEQRLEAVDAYEEKLGLKGHQRVIVLHEKLGREHIHVVWSRIDIATMRSVHDGHNYRKHEEVSRDLERRFGHDRVQGAHAEREGPDGTRVIRPDRTPSRAELRQEERTGLKGKDIKAEVTALYRASDGAPAFKAALARRGYLLAQGDRRDFVIVDRAGGTHSLARRIDGVNAAALREFLAPIDRASLPTAGEARILAEQRKRLAEAHEDALRERRYGRGADYVSQSRAALKDHIERQKELDQANRPDSAWERIEAAERRRVEEARREREARKQRDEAERLQAPSERKDDLTVRDGVEITEAMQARLDRLREAKSGYSSGVEAGRQNGAPGQGRPRSRS